MQSEFACHIGSMGKFFCRVCHVKGTDAKGKSPVSIPTLGQDLEHAQDVNVHTNEVPPNDPEVTPNDLNTPAAALGKGRKKPETLEEMVERVARFVKVCRDNLRVRFVLNFSCRLGSLGQNRTPAQNCSTCLSCLSRSGTKLR